MVRRFTLLDHSGRILWTSHEPPPRIQALGVTRDNMPGRLLWTITPDDDAARAIRAGFAEALLTNTRQTVTIANRIEDDRHDWTFHFEPLPGFPIITLTTHRVDHADQLSPRERDVLKHIAAGRTHAETASLLHISKSTVDSHRGNIARKLGTNTPLGIAVAAIRAGILEF